MPDPTILHPHRQLLDSNDPWAEPKPPPPVQEDHGFWILRYLLIWALMGFFVGLLVGLAIGHVVT